MVAWLPTSLNGSVPEVLAGCQHTVAYSQCDAVTSCSECATAFEGSCGWCASSGSCVATVLSGLADTCPGSNLTRSCISGNGTAGSPPPPPPPVAPPGLPPRVFVDAVYPDVVLTDTPLTLTVAGKGFEPGLTLKLGKEVFVDASNCSSTTDLGTDGIVVTPTALIVRVSQIASTGYQTVRVSTPSGGQVAVSRRLYVSASCAERGRYDDGSGCAPCPAGAECPGGDRLWPQAGYWTEAETAGWIEECSPRDRCSGGADSACSPGARGPLCGSCQSGYYEEGGVCAQCKKRDPDVAGLALLPLLALAAFVVPLVTASDAVFDSSVLCLFLFQLVQSTARRAPGSAPTWWRTFIDLTSAFAFDYSLVRPECVVVSADQALFTRIFYGRFLVLLALLVPVALVPLGRFCRVRCVCVNVMYVCVCM